MRVIAGTYKGRRLQTPGGLETRPTSDRVREALFSILGDRVQDARVLDLFAGSGALGIEALSRGAAQATFVDNAAPRRAGIGANLEALGADAEVVRAEVRRFLGGASRSARQYDLVFLDPPYRLAASLGSDLSGAPRGRPWHRMPQWSAKAIAACLWRSISPWQDERRYGDTLIRIHGSR